jgi:DNA-binding transcriptional regulator YiaG
MPDWVIIIALAPCSAAHKAYAAYGCQYTPCITQLAVLVAISMKKLDVKKIRERLGLSQAELAERLGVEQPSVSRWENDQPMSRPIRKLLEQLSTGK